MKYYHNESEIKVSHQIANLEPQAAYCCFITGFKHKVSLLYAYNINEELRRLDGTITNNKLMPSFTDNKLRGNDERILLSLTAME